MQTNQATLVKLIAQSPFEIGDTNLALASLKAGFFPILHLGKHQNNINENLLLLCNKTNQNFGVCTGSTHLNEINLPVQVSHIIVPFGTAITVAPTQALFYQIHTLQQAIVAKKMGANGIVIKGNEGAGSVGDESTFILFQQVINEVTDLEIWVQGGVGIQTGAAFAALGATGLVYDSQLCLFAECQAPLAIKQICEKLNGGETKVIHNYRILLRPNAAPPPQATQNDIISKTGSWDVEKNYLPLGQDIAFAASWASKYKTLGGLAFAIRNAIQLQLKKAKENRVIAPHNALANHLNITYPIAQGPMTRVSDVPAFAACVSNAGALPFIALSLLQGNAAKELLQQTSKLLANTTWGVGILGFAPADIRAAQLELIMQAKPPVVLIAGGRPSQALPLEKIGINVFLHVPSVAMLDIFIKEGAKNFVFEGRECGGHVGPLSSLVLWQGQIERLLQEEKPEQFCLFFAGGIHNDLSTAFISIMAAPLAAKGAKIGVLMGTAYIYTKEAVSSGAILLNFQQQAIQKNNTVLLETAPGHETRCLQTPFAHYFLKEKQNLTAQGLDKKTMWANLEMLNVGRLRVATKGIERKESGLQAVSHQQQLADGMFMIGQVAALKNEVLSMQTLHENVSVGNNKILENLANGPEKQPQPSLEIAIIGMACIFPGAENIEEYWHNIIMGKDSVTEVPAERWNKELYYHPTSTDGEMSHSKWGGFIPTIDFDPLAFGIPPQSLAAIEPAQLLALLVAKQALAHAGYEEDNYEGENISVIIGADGGNDLANNYAFRGYYKQVFGHMPAALDDALPKTTEDSFPGVLSNVISGRITNRLNLGGRNFTVDAACASSLAAIDLACQELYLGKSEMVIAGGVDLHNGINDYLMFSSTHALSRKGRCATFDSAADGIALGEGVAMVLLKRRADALRDGNTIFATIKAVGGSSDGKSLGLTAPRKNGQIKALERAYAQAGILPSQVGLIEAHGTGTVLGDKTEMSALTDVFLQTGATHHQAYLGSVKTQIGHTKCAAGLAGLIKATLAVYHGVTPPTIHLKNPNQFYNANTSPFAFNAKAGIWNNEKRIAGISAFGFGGTNFHAVIQGENKVANQASTLQNWPAELLVFRGNTLEDAMLVLQQVKQILLCNNPCSLKDIAYTLATQNILPVQVSIVANSAEALLSKLNIALANHTEEGIYYTKEIAGKVAFLFPGQGSQRVDMARDLFVAFPAMRQLLLGRKKYEEILYPPAAFEQNAITQQHEEMKDTHHAQPLLGIVGMGIANYLSQLGIKPDMVAGHSYGELPALCFAGVFNENVLVELSEKRATSIIHSIEGDAGAMVAISGSEEIIANLINEVNDVHAVNHNAPLQWVLAGTTAALQLLIQKLKSIHISYKQLDVACAFHSPLLAKSAQHFATAMQPTIFLKPTKEVWSNTTAKKYPTDEAGIKNRLAEHLVKPVLFAEQIKNMQQAGATIFIEVGPGKVLTTLTKSILGTQTMAWHTEEKNKDGITQLLHTIAAYMATARAVHLEKIFDGRNAKTINLTQLGHFQKSKTTWLVNGQYAKPLYGKLPAHGALPITQPILLSPNKNDGMITPQHTTEQVVLEMLSNIKQVVQAQRDVVMAYLGKTVESIASSYDAPIAPQQALVQNLATTQEKLYAALPENGVEKTNERNEVPTKTPTYFKNILLQIISDKTGYPTDMLGLNLDLEADLSIDSIKRIEIIGELKKQLGGFKENGNTEEQFLEKLSTIKTINGLVQLITENAKQPRANIQIAITTKQATLSNSNVFALTAPYIQTVLLTIISDKTGYPKDMLAADLDLEADLSIDSIKRIEIISELSTKLGLNHAGIHADTMLEKLTTIKTIDGMVTGILDFVHTKLEPVEEAKKIIEAGFDNSSFSNPITRLRFELLASPTKKQSMHLLQNKRFAVTNDGGLAAKAIKKALEKCGAIVEIIDAENITGNYDGLVILNLFASTKKMSITDSFSLIKKIETASLKWLFAVSDVQAYLTKKTDAKILRHIQGYTGFLKSLSKEYEHIKCRIISLTTKQSPTALATLILDEILDEGKEPEIIYEAEKRFTKIAVPAQLDMALNPHVQLNNKAVVLVFGGAQGITAEMMIRFAKDHPCHYILIGRTAFLPEKLSEVCKTFTNKEDVKKYLIGLGQLSKPALIEVQAVELFKQIQIANTIAAFQTNGSTVQYQSLDIRNEIALKLLLENVYLQYGKIDGVVHGAGLLEDKLFNQKTTESFERVFSTKVTPLRVLAECLQPTTKFVVFFSSVASVYGNKGQTDYAAANSVMDKYAGLLKKKIAGKVIAINWGPWQGAGMVSPSLEKEYQRRGIALIPLKDGIETFVNEINYGTESQVLIMAGSNKY